MGSLGVSCIAVVTVLLWLAGCETVSEQVDKSASSEDVIRIYESGPSPEQLAVAKEAFRINQYRTAADRYLQLDYTDASSGAVERAERLTLISAFYRELADFGNELQNELLTDWWALYTAGKMQSRGLPAAVVFNSERQKRWSECIDASKELDRISILKHGITEKALFVRATAKVANCYEAVDRSDEALAWRNEAFARAGSDPSLQIVAQLALGDDGSGRFAKDIDGSIFEPEVVNNARLDEAKLHVQQGRYLKAHQTLTDYDSSIPHFKETFDDAAELTRNFHSTAFLSLYSVTLQQLLARDLHGILQTVQDKRWQMLVHAGSVRLRMRDFSEAVLLLEEAEREIAKQFESIGAGSLQELDIFRIMARARLGAAYYAAGKHDKGVEIWGRMETEPREFLGEAAALGQATALACRAREVALLGNVAAGLKTARRAQVVFSTLHKNANALFVYRYYGALWAGAVLRQGTEKDRKDAVYALERVHQGRGYSARTVWPDMLLAMTRAYRADKNGLARKIMARFAYENFSEMLPANQILQSLTSANEAIKAPGKITRGDQ